MEIARCWSHGDAECVLVGKGLAEAYAEVRETFCAVSFDLGLSKTSNERRVVRARILEQLAGHGCEIDTKIFPASAPTMFHRGQYRLDATRRVGTKAALGIICYFGSAEFTVRKLMLISVAVRREIVDCGVLALMTRDIMPYVAGRLASYDQGLKLLRMYGQSEWVDIPMILWELAPTAVRLELPDGADALAGIG